MREETGLATKKGLPGATLALSARQTLFRLFFSISFSSLSFLGVRIITTVMIVNPQPMAGLQSSGLKVGQGPSAPSRAASCLFLSQGPDVLWTPSGRRVG